MVMTMVLHDIVTYSNCNPAHISIRCIHCQIMFSHGNWALHHILPITFLPSDCR